METLFPIIPGKAPFLTRSIVHLSEDWLCNLCPTGNIGMPYMPPSGSEFTDIGSICHINNKEGTGLEDK